MENWTEGSKMQSPGKYTGKAEDVVTGIVGAHAHAPVKGGVVKATAPVNIDLSYP